MIIDIHGFGYSKTVHFFNIVSADHFSKLNKIYWYKNILFIFDQNDVPGHVVVMSLIQKPTGVDYSIRHIQQRDSLELVISLETSLTLLETDCTSIKQHDAVFWEN